MSSRTAALQAWLEGFDMPAYAAQAVMLACDGGGLWVKRGSPFWQAVDSGEPGVKRRYINLSIENITTF